MKNAQLKLVDNSQIRVKREYVVGTDIFSDLNKVWTMVLFRKYLKFVYLSITVNFGYESEEL